MSVPMSFFLVSDLHPIFWGVFWLYSHYILPKFTFKSPGVKDDAVAKNITSKLVRVGLRPRSDISYLCACEQIISLLEASVFPCEKGA